MSTTNRYDRLHELTSKQLRVIDALDAGSTHEDAAHAAGVHRVTVTKWAKKHPAFVAELNRRRQERADNTSKRIESVTSQAIDVIGQAIEAGNLDASFRWMKHIANSIQLRQHFGPTESIDVLEAHASQWSDTRLLKDLTGVDSRLYADVLAKQLADESETTGE